jgi:hypothetical protein
MKKVFLFFIFYTFSWCGFSFQTFYVAYPVYLNDISYQTVYSCPSGYFDNGSSCEKTEYTSIPSSWGSEYNLSNNIVGGADAYVKTMDSSSCSGKYMTASGYTSIATPSYGNNGICYSDTGLYCKTYATSTSKILLPNNLQITCWDTTQNCNDSTYDIAYNYSGSNDKCYRHDYSCSTGKRYGLEYGLNSNKTDLFNRISDKETKATTYSSTILGGSDVIVNDNQGSMCVELGSSTFSQGSVASSYTINSISKSGF